VNAIYFYSDTCPHCEKVKPVLADLRARYPDFNLTELEVVKNAEGRDKFLELAFQYGIRDPGTPMLYIGNQVLVGDVEINSRLESVIIAEQKRLASCSNTTVVNVTPVTPACPPPASGLSLPLVVGAALVDSTNPCGLSVLVFLLISMAAAGSRKRILMVGGAYIAAMFLFHLLVGIGLFSVFALSGLTKLFALIGGVIALVLGLITLSDVLRNRENFLLSIPESKKGILGDLIRKASLPAAFVLGILAGILGFSCTGGIYISILGLMGRDMTIMAGLPWLILYNLIYVLPLVLVTLLVAYGLSPERAEMFRTRYKRELRLFVAVVLIALGAIILLGWLG
jgi:cytochrome c biogenesis protein CcdA